MLQMYRKSVAYGGLTALGIITAATRYLSFGAMINFNRTTLAPAMCNFMLRLVGVKIHVDIPQKDRKGICYFYNHNSFLDIFIIPMLGLKNTRFIITEGIKNVIPLHLCNLGVEVLYIPDTEKTAERIEFFKMVSRDLALGKYSVLCAPEGRHDWLHGISSFNRGVFHMAQAAGAPIQTLFFNIPRDSNPMFGPDMKPCDVYVTSKEMIETRDWKEAEINHRKEEVRKRFLQYYFDTYGDYGDSVK